MSVSQWMTMVSYWDLSDWVQKTSLWIMESYLLVAVLIVTPIAACLLRISRRPKLNALALFLLFVPGTVVSCSIFFAIFFVNDKINRVTFWQTMTKYRGIWLLLVLFWAVTAFNLFIWSLCELYRKCRKRPHPVTLPNRLLFWTTLLLGILSAASAYYLANYKTLQDAVESRDIRLVEKRLAFNLLGSTANNGYVETTSSFGTHTTSLVPLAVWEGNVELVKLLLENGGSLRAGGTQYTGNALSQAKGNTEMVECLLEYTKDANDGLLAAVGGNDLHIVELFLSRGADPFAPLADDLHGEGPTVFELADFGERYFNKESLDFLKEYVRGLDDPRKYVFAGEVEELRRALDSGVNPNALYPSRNPRETLLHWTVDRMYWIARTSPSALSSSGDKAFLAPRLVQYCEVVDVLLEHGADPNIHNVHGDTPLHVLARMPRFYWVDHENRPTENPFNSELETEKAVEESLLHVAHALIEHGGNPRLNGDKPHSSPLDVFLSVPPWERNTPLFNYFQSVSSESSATPERPVSPTSTAK